MPGTLNWAKLVPTIPAAMGLYLDSGISRYAHPGDRHADHRRKDRQADLRELGDILADRDKPFEAVRSAGIGRDLPGPAATAWKAPPSSWSSSCAPLMALISLVTIAISVWVALKMLALLTLTGIQLVNISMYSWSSSMVRAPIIACS